MDWAACVCGSMACSHCSPNQSQHCSCGQQHYIIASLAQRSLPSPPLSTHTIINSHKSLSLYPFLHLSLSVCTSLRFGRLNPFAHSLNPRVPYKVSSELFFYALRTRFCTMLHHLYINCETVKKHFNS